MVAPRCMAMGWWVVICVHVFVYWKQNVKHVSRPKTLFMSRCTVEICTGVLLEIHTLRHQEYSLPFLLWFVTENLGHDTQAHSHTTLTQQMAWQNCLFIGKQSLQSCEKFCNTSERHHTAPVPSACIISITYTFTLLHTLTWSSYSRQGAIGALAWLHVR